MTGNLQVELHRARTRITELETLLNEGLGAVSSSYMQCDAEWRAHDKIAGKHEKVVREWRQKVAALGNRL